MNTKMTGMSVAVLTLCGAIAMAQTTTQPTTQPAGGTTGQQKPQSGQGTTTPPAGQTASGDRRDANSATKSMDAQTFVREAAIGGMAEVELGQLAAGKASSDAVKQFAQRMVTDHTKANAELKTLAQSKNLTVPTELDAKHKQTRDTLAALSGAAFDRAYMDQMRKDHHQTVSDFRQQSSSGSDPEVKGWAAKTLPTLQEHMQLADRTNAGADTTGSQNGTSGGTGTNSTDRGSSGVPTGLGGGAGTTQPGTGGAR
jgi:putative membrane protein